MSFDLNVVLGWGRVLSYGSLYPTLKKLERRVVKVVVKNPDGSIQNSGPLAGTRRFWNPETRLPCGTYRPSRHRRA